MFKLDAVSFTIEPKDFEFYKSVLDNILSTEYILSKSRAMFGYKNAYSIDRKIWQNDGQIFTTQSIGRLMYGGNSRTLFQLHGSAMDFVVPTKIGGYEPRITRVDIAFDDFAGNFNIDQFVEFYTNGDFDRQGRRPSSNVAGDWLNKKEGRTLYIGSRQGSKMLRIYEKGKQLNSTEFPNWLRLEFEFKAADHIIPVDVLTNFRAYFAKAYPNLRKLYNMEVPDVDFKLKTAAVLEGEALWAHRMYYAKQQAGAVVFEHLMRNDGDIGSLVKFAVSTQHKVKRETLNANLLQKPQQDLTTLAALATINESKDLDFGINIDGE